jgi:hypothetical protein
LYLTCNIFSEHVARVLQLKLYCCGVYFKSVTHCWSVVLCGYLVYDYYLIVNLVLLLLRSLAVTVSFFILRLGHPSVVGGALEVQHMNRGRVQISPPFSISYPR